MASPVRLTRSAERQPDEADLRARLAASDPSALALVLDRYWVMLSRYAFRLLDDTDAANDVAQEAFVRLWEGRAALTSHGVGPYLYRIAHNLVVDEVRKRSVRGRWLRLPEASFAAPPPNPAELFERQEMRSAIERALQALPPRRREAFVLAYFHELSYREIADTAGISVATVKNHVAAALADLRAALHELRATERSSRH